MKRVATPVTSPDTSCCGLPCAALRHTQAEQDYAALHGQLATVQLPASGHHLDLPVGQEVAVDPTTGHVYAVSWAQDEWGKLAVAGVRELTAVEQQRYWSSRHLQLQ
jgi:hypothetical protein